MEEYNKLKIETLELKIEALQTRNKSLRQQRTILIISGLLLYLLMVYFLIAMDTNNMNELNQIKTLPAITIEVEEPNEYKQVVYKEPIIIDYEVFEVTGYCSCIKCCGKTDGITKSGVKVQANKTIAMDKSYPMGTEVLIEGFEDIVFEKQDIGGAITGNKIDIYFNTHQEALDFGRKTLKVWVLNSGNSE